VSDGVEVTALLRAWAAGQPGAADRVVPVIYQHLRRRAAAFLRGERRDHKLQPTALVHTRTDLWILEDFAPRGVGLDWFRRRRSHDAGRVIPGPGAEPIFRDQPRPGL
jgi:ECF sigma factor